MTTRSKTILISPTNEFPVYAALIRLVYQVENACLNDQQKSAIAERLAVAEHCLLEGSDEYLQVNFPLSEVLLVFCSIAYNM